MRLLKGKSVRGLVDVPRRWAMAAVWGVLLVWAPLGFSQANNGSRDGAAAGAGASAGDVEILRAPEQAPVEPKTFTKAQVRLLCKRVEGKLIAYYDDIYRVQDCQRRPVIRHRTVYDLQRGGQKIIAVDSDIIAALPEGAPIDVATTSAAARGCKALSGKYVALNSTEVYFVQDCKKRLFPDWSTYTKHRDQRGEKLGRGPGSEMSEILILSWVEFESLADGEPFTSVLDGLYTQMLGQSEEPDVIPIDEACRGIEGRHVAYYSRLYKIERCRRREYPDPEVFIKRHGRAQLKIVELSGEQWLSLPEGEPMSGYVQQSARRPQEPLSNYSPN